MGLGASKEELREGSVVTGLNYQRVIMPEGTVGQQLPDGPYPEERVTTPRLVGELHARKGTLTAYEQLIEAIKGCGGLTGWQSSKIEEVLARFQATLNEHGVGATYNMVQWYDGFKKKMEYRYYIEFTDFNMPRSLRNPLLGLVEPEPSEPPECRAANGAWFVKPGITGDLSADLRRIIEGTVVITVNSGIANADVKIKRRTRYVPVPRTFHVVGILHPKHCATFELRFGEGVAVLDLVGDDALVLKLPLLFHDPVPFVPMTTTQDPP